jgi:hypothetical protein
MIIDKRLQVSSQQALTGTSLVPSADVIDLGSLRLIGPGDPMWWVIAARVGLAGTTPTLDIAVQTDDASGFASPANLLSYPQLAAAGFVTGTRIVIPMTFTNERFLRLAYTMGGTTPTATVDAWLTNQHPSAWSAQADAI